MVNKMRRLMVFPGYGSQHIGMLKDIPEEVNFKRVSEAAAAYTQTDVEKIAFEGPRDALDEYQVAYPLITIANTIWGTLLYLDGIESDWKLGYDLGFFSAIAQSGIISIGAAVALSVKYAESIKAAINGSDGAQAVVMGLSPERLAELIEEYPHVWLAYDNSVNNQVLSGALSSLEVIKPTLLEEGARRVTILSGVGALHSPMMEKVAKDMREVFKSVELAEPTNPLVSLVEPRLMEDSDEIVEDFLKSICTTVKFRPALLMLESEYDMRIVLESGPGSVLTGHALRIPNITPIPVTQYANSSGLEALHRRISSVEAANNS